MPGPMGGKHGAPFKTGEAAKHPMKTLGRLMKIVLSKYKFLYFIVLVCIGLSAVATLLGTLFQQSLIDDYIVPLIGSVNPDFGQLGLAIIKISLVYLVGIGCGYAYQRIMVTIGQGSLKLIRDNTFSHMETLPIKYFDTHAHGDIMSIYTNDIDTLRQLITSSIPEFFSTIITVTITFVSMINISVWLTLVSVFMVFVSLFVSVKIAGKSGKYFIAQQKSIASMNGYIEEMIQGQKVVKVFCHEEQSVDGFLEKNEDVRVAAKNAHITSNIIMPINGNIGHISYVLIAVIGALLALSGAADLTLGMIVAFLTLNKNFSRPISQISSQVNTIVQAMAGADRVFALIDEASEVSEGDVTLVRVNKASDGSLTETTQRTGVWAWKVPACEDEGEDSLVELKGDVLFKDVDFAYNADRQILYDINIFATPGQKIAFVGSTGAGKTTITNLINRFYDIMDGEIYYDGIDIKRIKKDDLRRSLGMVLQETNLFTGTVMENIRYGRLDATDEECIAAAKLVNSDGFIRRLPEGYNTMLKGDGSNLSQGQRQLLSITRAAVCDPPVLILDEATSSVDTRTEALVQRGMDSLMKGRTTFVIAHRLSTVKNSDCIMVLEGGRIIERGSHDELIEKRGKYYSLYTGNFEEQSE